VKKHLSLSIIFLSVLFLASVCFGAPQNTSTTTAASIIEKARDLLNEETAGFWDDEELLRWLNDGMSDIAEKALCLQATETINMTNTTVEYTPTTSYIKVIDVWYTDSDGNIWALKNATPGSRGINRVEKLTDSDGPSYWYEFNGKLGVFPPVTSVTSETLTVFFAQQSTDVTASQNVGTPAVFDSCLVNYIASMAHLKDRQLDDFDFYWKRYEAELNRFRMDWIEQPKQTDPIVD
jgi:hypothetical protein